MQLWDRISRTPEEPALFERYAKRYARAESDVLLQTELAACGCDYGATSWTTRELASTRRVLEEELARADELEHLL
ncbi:MAG: hypothetical protein OET44_01055 [Gammaproteobacteria bacterium]|nr:hypothetical protein [Gammaproteobacteria bacterium]